MGDFNAQFGNLEDYTNKELTCLHPLGSRDFENRNSRDTGINSYGRSLSELCIGNDLLILNGRTNGDSLRTFTCHTYNGSSVVDYAIVSHSLYPLIKFFAVSNTTEFSHHTPITFALEANTHNLDSTNVNLDPDTFCWDSSLRKELVESFENAAVQYKLDYLFDIKNNMEVDIDLLVNNFTKIFVYNKALKAYHSLLRNFSSVGSTPVKVLLKLFDCVVAPVLLYGCEVWGANTLGKIASPNSLAASFSVS